MVLGLYTEAAIPATCAAHAPSLTCAPAPAAKLVLVAARADYAWQDEIQFNVIKDVNYRGAYGTVGGTCRWNPAR